MGTLGGGGPGCGRPELARLGVMFPRRKLPCRRSNFELTRKPCARPVPGISSNFKLTRKGRAGDIGKATCAVPPASAAAPPQLELTSRPPNLKLEGPHWQLLKARVAGVPA